MEGLLFEQPNEKQAIVKMTMKYLKLFMSQQYSINKGNEIKKPALSVRAGFIFDRKMKN